MKDEFVHSWWHAVGREGRWPLLEWLEKETDFFTAPASAGHHLNEEGGLVVHSLHVYERLLEIAERDLEREMTEEERETAAVIGLLHDVCKIGLYHRDASGAWVKQDKLPLGHGEKSVYLIQKKMELRSDEALAIRWHMGAYDAAAKGGSRELNAAMIATPWVWWLHEADMAATQWEERQADD